MKARAGQLLSGTVRLLRKLADGGMGSVWLAEHVVLGKRVAVKVMSPQWALMPAAQARFLREARMTAAIDSPHVVRLLDCRMSEADEPYLVLELLQGENLDERVDREGPLSIFDAAEIVSQACAAIAASHRAGILHRDLKPENVFLIAAERPLVKVLDFGVARPSSPEACSDEDKMTAGTPRYMSPEQMFDPEAIDERSDLFSLGAVAYFALTGEPPFAAETLEGIYFAVEGAAFLRPSDLTPEMPAELDAWFEKALAREPADRFADADEMALALLEAVASLREGRPTTPAPPVGRRRRRSALALAAAALAAALWWTGVALHDALADDTLRLLRDAAGAPPWP